MPLLRMCSYTGGLSGRRNRGRCRDLCGRLHFGVYMLSQKCMSFKTYDNLRRIETSDGIEIKGYSRRKDEVLLLYHSSPKL